MKVYILAYSHKHGQDLSAYATEALAEAAKVGIAKEWWEDRADDEAPDDYAALTEDEIVTAYFDENDREWADIEALDVMGAA
jgi:hypothetical protein